MMVPGVTLSHAATSISKATRMLMFGIGLLFSIAVMYICTAFDLKWALRALITPWSMGCVFDVVLGGRNTKLIAFRSFTRGWAGQLSTISTTFLPSLSNLLSSSLIHSSKRTPSIQLFLCALYLLGIFRTPEKHWSLVDFPITNKYFA